jgi:MraZ protein
VEAGRMYMGESDHSLDSKGRLIIPSRFKEGLGEKIIISKAFDPCLYIYDLAAWEDFVSRLNKLPSISEQTRKLRRHFIGGSFEVEIDKQGRALIPAKLREYARINKDIVLSGVGSNIELWSKEEMDACGMEPEDIKGIAEDLFREGYEI